MKVIPVYVYLLLLLQWNVFNSLPSVTTLYFRLEEIPPQGQKQKYILLKVIKNF